MNYPEALDRIARIEREAKADSAAGLHAMREYYEMTVSLTSQVFGKTEDEVRADVRARIENNGSISANFE